MSHQLPSNPEFVRVVPWTEAGPAPSQEEAEARLHQEGYASFKWYDVPGACYPSHHHSQDECLWILKGELIVEIEGREYILKAGDRIYLPAQTPHTSNVSPSRSVTYLVGQKKGPA